MRVRNLSGGGTPTNNVDFSTGSGTDGWIGFYVKTTSAGWNAQLWIEGASVNGGVPKNIIADGQWHAYEWNLDDNSGGVNGWGSIAGLATGTATVSNGLHQIDSIVFRNPANTTGDLFLDFVARSDSGSITNIKFNQTITFSAITAKVYGDSFNLSATADSGLPVSYSILSGPATLSGNTVTVTNTGSSVTVRASQAGNTSYNAAANVDRTFNVGPAPLNVTAQDTNRGYGSSNPSFTATLTGFKLGEDLSTSDVTGAAMVSTVADETSAVGTHAITPSAGTLASSHYSFSFVPGTLTITPATLTVTANNASRPVTESNPAFTYSVSGFVNGENESVLSGSPVLTTTATPASPVGNYPIQITAGTLSAANYSFSFVDGTLSVEPTTDLFVIQPSDLATNVSDFTPPHGTGTNSFAYDWDSAAPDGAFGAPNGFGVSSFFADVHQAGATAADRYRTLRVGLRTLFGRNVTIGEVAGISYKTRKNTPATAVDWRMTIYTAFDSVNSGNVSSWYRSRLQATPGLALSLNAPAGQWNTWSTAAGDNQFQFKDNRAGFGTENISWSELTSGPVTRGSTWDWSSEEIMMIDVTLGANSGGGDAASQLDAMIITLMDGSVATLDLEQAVTPIAFTVYPTELAGSVAEFSAPHGTGTNAFAYDWDSAAPDFAASAPSGFGDSSFFASVTNDSGSGPDANAYRTFRIGLRSLFGRAITIGELVDFSYQTEKDAAQNTVDWRTTIYTAVQGTSGNAASWYRSRLQSTPSLALNLNAPASQWNEWATRSGTNQIQFKDNRAGFGTENITWNEIISGPVTRGANTWDWTSEEVMMIDITLGANAGGGTAASQLDAVKIRLSDGTVAVLDLQAPQPVPVLTDIDPEFAVIGSAGITLTVNGSDFTTNSVVQWNGAARTTTFVSANQLTAVIPASDLVSAGSVAVTVFTGAPGGGTSASQTFQVFAHPATVYVDAEFTAGNSGGHIWGYDAFTTIQQGVDAVTASGTVNVPAGTYNEDVNIWKPLNLVGAGAGSSIVVGPIGGAGSTFTFASTGIVLEGFTITRAGNNLTDWNNSGLNTAGVAMQGASSSGTVRNCLITGMRTGIDINNASNITLRNNVISDNRTGLILRNVTDNLTVVENVITDNWTVGILFLDASSGSNVPLQKADNCTFSGNNISGNWYGEIVDRQTGGSLPAPGANLKNFSGNWLGTNAPVVVTANSAEPGYAAQIPVEFGGTATNPGGAPTICGTASANIDYTPWLDVGTDTSATMGFQGDFHTLHVDDNSAQTGAIGRIQEGINSVSGSTVIVAPGLYSENIVVSSNIVIDGAGSGTDSNVDTIITSATANIPVVQISAGGASSADRLTLRDVRLTGATGSGNSGSGIALMAAGSFYEFNNVVSTGNAGHGFAVNHLGLNNDIIVTDCSFSNNAGTGFRIPTAGSVDGLAIALSHFDGNAFGLEAYMASGSGSVFKNVSIADSSFNNNTFKGIYAEKLSDAVLQCLSITNSGTSGTFAAGIDINLKYGVYNNIQILDSTIADCGTSDSVNGAGITVKARNDAPSYNSNPALVTNVLLSGLIITGSPDAIRFGETGKNNAGPINVTVRYCNLADNTRGIRNESLSPTDAKSNWWGSVTGPTNVANPGGAGISASAGVNFSPWLGDGADTSLSCGFQPDTLNVNFKATTLTFSTQPSDAGDGLPFAIQPVVQVLDENNNVATAFNGLVTMHVTNSLYSGILGGQTEVYAVNGVATFTDLFVVNSGSGFTLIATSLGLTSSTSDPFDVIGLPMITAQPQNIAGPVNEGADVAFSVTAINGTLAYQWKANGAPISGATDSSLTWPNTQPGDTNIAFTVEISNLAGTVESSSAYILSVTPDTTAPTVSVTTPVKNKGTNVASIFITGVAKDTGVNNSGIITAVKFVHNDGATNDAVISPAGPAGTWSFTSASPIALTPGTNTLNVWAVDLAGNVSTLAPFVFFYDLTNTLTLNIVGNGNVKFDKSIYKGPTTNIADVFKVGRPYQLDAYVNNGTNYVFSSWTTEPVEAGYTTNQWVKKASLSFVMQENMVINANFVTNPFTPLAGSYNGLFADPTNVTHEMSGFIQIKVKDKATYSGFLFFDGFKRSFTGKFGLDGTSSATVLRTKFTPQSPVQLSLNLSGELITGSVSATNGAWTSPLLADKAVFSTTNPETANDGKYTFVIPPGIDAPSASPGGFGYGTVTNNNRGIISLSGLLSDGEKIAQKVSMSRNGNWPLYTPLYRNVSKEYKGSLIGWLSFTNGNFNTNNDNVLTWIKKDGSASLTRYPAGFSNSVEIAGSPYLPVGPTPLTVGSRIILSEGNLTEPQTNIVTSVIGFRVNYARTNELGDVIKGSLGFRSRNGAFYPVDKSTINGVFLQNSGTSKGFFLGTTESGTVRFE